MNNNDRKEQELRAREQELEQRALELRLRELDAEINPRSVPFYPTQKDQKLTRTLKQDLVNVAKFSGLFLGGVAVVYVSQWLASQCLLPLLPQATFGLNFAPTISNNSSTQ
jgi:hypothetical protein